MLRFKTFCICIAMAVFPAAGYSQTPQLNVSVYNDAGVAQAMLKKAEFVAAAVMGRAGVHIDWANCSGRGTSASWCDHPDGELSLRIAPNTIQSTEASVFGVAFLSAEGSGRYADVFYSRALQLHNDGEVSLSELLGCVMAHELGHLLLGSNAHSGIGIMQRQWRTEQLKQIQRGELSFTTDQARAMQQRMRADSERQALASAISFGHH